MRMADRLVRVSIWLMGVSRRFAHQINSNFNESKKMTSLPDDLAELIGLEVREAIPLGGGSINQVYRLKIDDSLFCLKVNHHAPAEFFLAEKNGLEILASSGTVRTPQVLDCGANYLLLEWLQPSKGSVSQSEQLGLQLAALHEIHGTEFGFTQDNYCGETLQINTPCESGYVFFAQHRLFHQLKLAQDKDLLNAREVEMIGSINDRLEVLVPAQPPSLLHGDLWNGNVLVTDQGPVLIDPAVYFGWAEADLAMTKLFGGFSNAFYQSYLEARPLESGFEDRVPLYNLYHLLNHLNLFGSGWHASVMQVARHFAIKG